MKTNNKKIIIGIVGENASGKTTLTKYLHKRYSAETIKFSDMLSDILDRLYLEKKRENFQTLSTILRKNFGEDVMSRVVAKDVELSQKNIIVTEGIRRPFDIKYLQKIRGFYLISIYADPKTRFKRLKLRSEKDDDKFKTWEEFKKESMHESEQKIKNIAKKADFEIDNNKTIQELYKQADYIMQNILKNI